MPSERVIVPSLEAVSPVPAVGVPLARSGGHAVAHAPVHALMVPESALNRYRARPVELTRIDPRLLFATPRVAEAPVEVCAPRPKRFAFMTMPVKFSADVVSLGRGLQLTNPDSVNSVLVFCRQSQVTTLPRSQAH